MKEKISLKGKVLQVLKLNKHTYAELAEHVGLSEKELDKQFADNSLDFVYIDANHQDPYVTQDITAWQGKVRPGGILAGHDYARPRGKDGAPQHNVKGAVQTYAAENNIRPWFVLGSFKAPRGEQRDSVRSWMWIKV